MGGKMDIQSKKNVGTTIKFLIKFDLCPDTFCEEVVESGFDFKPLVTQRALEDVQNSKAIGNTDDVDSKVSLDVKNSDFSVLIVEDNDLNVSVLKHFISKVNKNLKPSVARDGVVGLDLYKKFHFQFIFMDLVCFFFIMLFFINHHLFTIVCCFFNCTVNAKYGWL